jgi:hypothetical protein
MLPLIGVLAIPTSSAEAGDGSVRFLTAGPVRLGPGGSAQTRLLLPAVKPGGAEVVFLGEGGQVLARVDVQPPSRTSGPFFDVAFEVGFDTRGGLSITDGTSNTIFSGPSSGIIAILIGLRSGGQGPAGALGRVRMTSLQVFDAAGQTVGILPYLEQDN